MMYKINLYLSMEKGNNSPVITCYRTLCPHSHGLKQKPKCQSENLQLQGFTGSKGGWKFWRVLRENAERKFNQVILIFTRIADRHRQYIWTW